MIKIKVVGMSVLNRLPILYIPKCPRRLICFSRLLCRSSQTKPKNRITSFLLDKYVTFVKSCEKTLSENFPTALKFYQVYSVGMKLFKDDVVILYRGYKKANSEGWNSLSRKELEIYYQMPKDIIRATPTVIVGTFVPFCGFMFLFAFYFPRQMLTHHFWSLQQKSEFSLIYHRQKLQSFKPVLFSMQKQLMSLEGDHLYEPMKQILDCLSCGVHPSADLILACKPLFKKHYNLSNLSNSHIAALLKMYNLHRGWRRKRRLEFRASLILLIDAAIIREGGFEKLSQDEIKWNCFLRGLNPINMKQEDIFKWINTWLKISQEIDQNSFSLLLHCPVLLGYNQPSNWWLLHNKR